MYLTSAPDLHGTRRSGWQHLRLGLTLIHHRFFAADGASYSAADRTYFSDLLALHRVPYRPEMLSGTRTTFRDMMEGLLPALSRFGGDLGVAVQVSSTPDAEPGWPMPYLSASAAQSNLLFALADQGPTAPFTAMRVAADVAELDGAGRSVVVVMDQAAVQHGEPIPERLRATRNSAVALVFDETAAQGRVAVQHLSGAAPAEVAGILARELAATPSTVVCGPALARHCGTTDVYVAEPGLPCTGVWATLAAHLDQLRAAGTRTVVCDYDEELGYLGLCAVDWAVPR
ncbi:hypothetical protein [Plantactinospora sp. KLBMP9567]|uniref:hypothetical protein n=1 Tax=Plantactinospora sp. KLBMP9567 TaxID=3085900 RepID=UPI002981D24D|nr:hypothetical protein [Plantactinospora sp. KLBMP9567]MDW5329525.1 hypothetical protein [Plantactinospora sp. KLBMP9567]